MPAARLNSRARGGGTERAVTMESLRAQCESCRECELGATRANLVFGDGDESADIMFVGEAPGKTEDERGVPFVGRAGELLNSYLAAVGLSRERVYIANILKCRPPDNRDPLPHEQDKCIHWLREQFKAVSPKLVVCLGRIAAQRLISEGYRVTKEHGLIIRKGGALMTGTFHPAALLRNPAAKADALDDFQKIAALAANGFVFDDSLNSR